MRTIFLAAALLGGVATPALAQQQPVNFSGPRVEALVGYDAIKAGDEEHNYIAEDEDSAEGATYGVRAGYDFDLGTLVAGADAEISGTSAKVRDDVLGGQVKFGRDLYIGGRLGVKATPSTLIYAGAGYTNTAVKASFDDNVTSFRVKGDVDGYRLTGGVEQKLSANTFGRLEYRYSNYGDLKIDDVDGNTDINLDRHQVVASLGFRF